MPLPTSPVLQPDNLPGAGDWRILTFKETETVNGYVYKLTVLSLEAERKGKGRGYDVSFGTGNYAELARLAHDLKDVAKGGILTKYAGHWYIVSSSLVAAWLEME